MNVCYDLNLYSLYSVCTLHIPFSVKVQCFPQALLTDKNHCHVILCPLATPEIFKDTKCASETMLRFFVVVWEVLNA